MNQEDVRRIAEAVLASEGAKGFAIVIDLGTHTMALVHNVDAAAAGDILHATAQHVPGPDDKGQQRPALFN